ncbi:MAG: SPASM domain-containing protein, partial [Candidatus Electrothrix sp. MAN1_4]|nr:SPASM domain-containing protein [Candidatus Electrothrix sp. MAN1_4]
FGGEPLLYPSFFNLLEMFQRNMISPKIATNGILLTPEVVDKLVDYGVGSIQISIDTLNHSVFRQLTGGCAQELKKILDNLNYLLKSPIRTVVSSTITSINLKEIPYILDSLFDIGVDSYTTYLLTPGSTNHNEKKCRLSCSELPVLLEKLLASYNKTSQTRIVDVNYPWFVKTNIYKKWSDKIELRCHGCGAGLYTLSIKSNGDVSPCICNGSKKFVCGNIRESSVKEIWNSEKLKLYHLNNLQVPECKGCEYLKECRGGCRNNASVLSGNQESNPFDKLCGVL